MKRSIPELQAYLQALTPNEREKFAAKVGTSVGYLYQLAGGHRKAGAGMAIRIQRETDDKVSRHCIRPDYFCEIAA